jgi:lysophospholipase L1-like esterase
MKRSIIPHTILTVFFALFLFVPCSFAQEQWRYTALGDSWATGYLAQQGYVSLYNGYLQTDNGVGVTLYNLAQNGWTSGNLLNALRTDPVFQNAVSQANVITWDIGSNDFKNARASYQSRKCGGKDNQSCLRNAVATFKANWDAILVEILSRRSVSSTIIRTMDMYYARVQVDKATNTFDDNKEPPESRGNDFQVLSYYFNQMNNYIASTASIYSIPMAQVHQAYNGVSGDEDPVAKGYIATDGSHPSNTGHQVIANLFRGLGYAPLR